MQCNSKLLLISMHDDISTIELAEGTDHLPEISCVPTAHLIAPQNKMSRSSRESSGPKEETLVPDASTSHVRFRFLYAARIGVCKLYRFFRIVVIRCNAGRGIQKPKSKIAEQKQVQKKGVFANPKKAQRSAESRVQRPSQSTSSILPTIAVFIVFIVFITS
jgi:hypothetical protein